MRTENAVTPMPGIVAPFVIFTALYIFLAFIVFFLLRRQFIETAGPVSEISATSTDA
jgi:cytochrome d ubiquinol oxidase subunit I